MATSRDIVLSSLNHRQPERIPIEFGGTSCSGIHVSVVAELREKYGLEKRLVKVHEPFQMLGYIDEDLVKALGVDTAMALPVSTFFGIAPENWKEWRTPWGQEVLMPGKFTYKVADNGDILSFPEGDSSVSPSLRMPKSGYFFDAISRQGEIDDDTLDVKDNLEEFKPFSDDDLRRMGENAKVARATGRAVIGGGLNTGLGDIACIPATFMKHPKGVRDVEEWYVSLVARPDFVREIFAYQTDIAIKNLERVHKAVGDNWDVLFLCGTDFGTQTGTFCSIDTLQEMYIPHYRRMNDWIHKNTNWKSFKHCCGAIENFIGPFIEAGFDVLNPVQCSATGMEPQKLKEKYGSRIVFWGGGVDTQKTLPFGTEKQVREEVLERCRIFSPGGGFVFNAIHNVQAMTPVNNFIAMINAVHDFNGKRV